MKKFFLQNNIFFISILIIILTFTLVLITTLLLDWNFIQEKIARQLVIYLLILVQLYSGVKAVILINK